MNLKNLLQKSICLFEHNWGKNEDQPEDEFVHQKTQYSADTGRIIPPSSKSYLHRSHSQHLKYPQPFQDQELTVLELLCQILQTDSLSTVQQWLLLAGQREKDLVMGMLRRALDAVDLSGRRNQRTFQQLQAFHPGASPPAYSPSFDQPWRKPWRTSSYKANPISGDDKPERIGDAEVLEIHAGPQDHPQDPALQSA
ncbi:protein TBATA-like isoform X2 [Amphiprion ocellaris]|uniref:protein TBATA-like isoform X2 n=1 Tax=Amphiprion ocellaris TaxID=80972 RepID=UPI001649F121|nr:protein TBATA-like isoform X2 [Amphiprion ocellaris]